VLFNYSAIKFEYEADEFESIGLTDAAIQGYLLDFFEWNEIQEEGLTICQKNTQKDDLNESLEFVKKSLMTRHQIIIYET